MNIQACDKKSITGRNCERCIFNEFRQIRIYVLHRNSRLFSSYSPSHHHHTRLPWKFKGRKMKINERVCKKNKEWKCWERSWMWFHRKKLLLFPQKKTFQKDELLGKGPCNIEGFPFSIFSFIFRNVFVTYGSALLRDACKSPWQRATN